MTSQTTPENPPTVIIPDKLGRPLTITDPNSKVTTREYDNVGNLKLLKQPTGNGAFTTTNYFYTARNEIDYETDPADALHFIDYDYDDEGHQSFRHDRRDNGATGTIERTTEQMFRADGRLTESKAGAGLSEQRSVFGYDPDGNATSVNTYKERVGHPQRLGDHRRLHQRRGAQGLVGEDLSAHRRPGHQGRLQRLVPGRLQASNTGRRPDFQLDLVPGRQREDL